MTFSDTLLTGLNNPDCAFYVGIYQGLQISSTLVVKLALVYFGFRTLEKGVSLVYHHMRNKIRGKTHGN